MADLKSQTSRSVDALNQRNTLLHYFFDPHQGADDTVSYIRIYNRRSTYVASVPDNTGVAPCMEPASALSELQGYFQQSCNSSWNKFESLKNIRSEGKRFGAFVPKRHSAIQVPVNPAVLLFSFFWAVLFQQFVIGAMCGYTIVQSAAVWWGSECLFQYR